MAHRAAQRRGLATLLCAVLVMLTPGCRPQEPEVVAPPAPTQPQPTVTSSPSPSPTRTVTPAPSPSTPSPSPSPEPTASPVPSAPAETVPPQASEPPQAARAYAFPIEPASAATYGRDHHDYPATDIFAPCGTAVVAPAAGTVDEVATTDTWDPEINDGATRGGLSVSIVGDDGVRYYGSHFETIGEAIRPGARVEPGQALGTVGRTGSARPTPCHLHFGLSPPCAQGDWEVRRGVVYPWPYLDSWREGEDRSPAGEVAEWAGAHPDDCPGA